MNTDAQTGLTLLCGVLGIPFVAGVALGVRLGLNAARRGWYAALMPGFIRRAADKTKSIYKDLTE